MLQSALSASVPAPQAGPIANVAAYRFVELNELPRRRRELQRLCGELTLKGTILLSGEGLNLFVAGEQAAVEALLAALRSDPLLADLDAKISYSDAQPFSRMLVKIKEEIIAFGVEGIEPQRKTSKRIAPRELRDWLAAGRDVVLLDVRNNYEVNVGTFAQATPVNVDHFREFPSAVAKLPAEFHARPVVTFCTGGIRCEKAGPYLEQAGFQDVYQLDGGILKYFADVGGDFFQGECFVFDQRVALDPALQPARTKQCYACRAPVSPEDQQSALYDPPRACPHCHRTPEEKQAVLRVRREGEVQRIATPLPGSVSYDNVRPLNVKQRYDGLTLLEYLQQAHPHVGVDAWRAACASGKIQQKGVPVSAERIVRGGEQFAHLHPATIEPEVSAEIRILYEDDALVVVHKPAPLPLHPCGRFHRNTLQWILNRVYAPLKLRPVHRLDANTTGIVVFAKTGALVAKVQPQFENGEVEKTYLVRAQGTCEWDRQTCDAAISRESTVCGGRIVTDDGLASRTHFERLKLNDDGTTLLQATPDTGRTNQIRIHLWHLGHPVCGDQLYLPGGALGDEQTLPTGGTMCLHAWRLRLGHPVTGEQTTFAAPAPEWAMDCLLGS